MSNRRANGVLSSIFVLFAVITLVVAIVITSITIHEPTENVQSKNQGF